VKGWKKAQTTSSTKHSLGVFNHN